MLQFKQLLPFLPLSTGLDKVLLFFQYLLYIECQWCLFFSFTDIIISKICTVPDISIYFFEISVHTTNPGRHHLSYLDDRRVDS